MSDRHGIQQAVDAEPILRKRIKELESAITAIPKHYQNEDDPSLCDLCPRGERRWPCSVERAYMLVKDDSDLEHRGVR